MVKGTPKIKETAFYLDLAIAVAQEYSEDLQAVTTVAEALDAAYALAGIYEDFTLFFGAALQIAARFDDSGLFERLRHIVDDDGSTPPAGLAGHRALLDALTSPVGDAEEHFLTALRHYRAWGSPVHTARGQAAYGVWLSRQDRLQEAEPLLTDARTTYASLGAVAWLEELEQSLAASGVGS